MPFIIVIPEGYGNDYYGGSTFVHQGEIFPSLVMRDEAKRYKSRKVAENSAKALGKKCGCDHYVMEVPE